MGKGRSGRALTLRVPAVDGHFTMEVRIPRGSLRLRDIVPLAQRITEVNVERAVELEKKEGREVSCKRGCAACCRQLVPVSAPEAFLIADHVLALDEHTREEYLRRIDAAESTVAASELMQELQAIAGGAPIGDAKSLAARYFGLRIACPFLVDESCGVYPERPLVCRDYLVTSPPELCSLQTRGGVRTVRTPPVLSNTLSRVSAALTGEPAVMIPLVIAMSWVDAHADLGFREWPAAEVMGVLLREVGITEAEVARFVAMARG